METRRAGRRAGRRVGRTETNVKQYGNSFVKRCFVWSRANVWTTQWMDFSGHQMAIMVGNKRGSTIL